jgi:murein DD-endopeptidase MepM/ murein hydrolase activator NlpD
MTILAGRTASSRALGFVQRALVYGASAFALAGLAMQLGPLPIGRAASASAAANPVELLPLLADPGASPKAARDPAELFELTLRLPAGGDLSKLLVQAGAAKDDAANAARLIAAQTGDGLGESDVKLALSKENRGLRVQRLAILGDTGEILLQRDGNALAIVPAPAGLRKIGAEVEGSIYGTLRSAGLDASAASEASTIAGGHGGVGAGDHVTAVLAQRPARFGTETTPRLVYLKVERGGRTMMELLRWPAAPGGWVNPDVPADDEVLMRPVPGAITSDFGLRLHPILHFFRIHRGLDFAAGWGEPVRAAADGIVSAAGWDGGYGRQVRLEHRGDLGTSYSHLSSIVVQPGDRVRKGEVIGLAGASGLATGPHLHFEVYRRGQAIDPLRARLGSDGGIGERHAIEARLLQIEAAPSA